MMAVVSRSDGFPSGPQRVRADLPERLAAREQAVRDLEARLRTFKRRVPEVAEGARAAVADELKRQGSTHASAADAAHKAVTEGLSDV